MPAQKLTLAQALRAHGLNTFAADYDGTPAARAQKALRGLTPWAEPGQLSFHKSRIVGCMPCENGAFLKVTENASRNYEGTSRGFRVVLFDRFGSAIYCPSLSELHPTKLAAEKAFYAWLDALDASAHYAKACADEAARLKRQAADRLKASRAMAKATR